MIRIKRKREERKNKEKKKDDIYNKFTIFNTTIILNPFNYLV